MQLFVEYCCQVGVVGDVIMGMLGQYGFDYGVIVGESGVQISCYLVCFGVGFVGYGLV